MSHAEPYVARLEITGDALRKVLAHAAASDAEVCGALVGHGRPWQRITMVIPGTNVHETPRRHFLLDAATLLHADQVARDHGWAIVGFYHSHPGGNAVPSRQDRHDVWPDHLMLIVGGGASLPLHLCAWLVAGTTLQPLPIVTPSAADGA